MQRIARTMCLFLALLGCLLPAASAASPEFARYIVVLNEQAANPATAAAEIAGQAGGQVGFIYAHAIKGFSITVPTRAAAALAKNPLVKYLANDDVRQASVQTVPTGIWRIFAADNGNLDIDGSDDYRVDADVAVIDTGIDFHHPDLHVAGGVNCSEGNPFSSNCTPGGDDDNYHGTHVAGTIGALDNGDGVVGVAPGARLWAVKVLNSRGSGFASWIIAGIDWVAANSATIEVANMSLGGSYNEAECAAIQGAVDKGVAFAVAAGNEDDDARNYGPAACSNVLTVSALADFDGIPGGLGSPTCTTDQDDTLADFSNWGPAVDIAAPGICITSTIPLERGSYGILSGTSMASPHAAGALALLASTARPLDATGVNALYAQAKSAGNFNWLDDSGDGIKEPLLDVGTFNAELIATGITNAPPVTTITSPDDGASFAAETPIAFSGTASDPEDGDLSDSLAWESSLDGTIGSGASFNTTLSIGVHTITATATDSGSLTGSDSVTITVAGAGGGITLMVDAYKVKSIKTAALSWNGAASTYVDVYRNSSIVTSTLNDGAYTDTVGKKVTTATYKVCETGTTTCSNSVTVGW